MSKPLRIIGIDPGLGCTGWGVIEYRSAKPRHIANGSIRSKPGELPGRLLFLHQSLQEVVRLHSPEEAAIEQTFINRDGAGSLKLAHARGAALLVPAQAGLPVAEYAPNKVKKAVVGTGHAQKEQIAHMVQLLLPGAQVSSSDAADALAIAICHAHYRMQNLALRRIKEAAI